MTALSMAEKYLEVDHLLHVYSTHSRCHEVTDYILLKKPDFISPDQNFLSGI